MLRIYRKIVTKIQNKNKRKGYYFRIESATTKTKAKMH